MFSTLKDLATLAAAKLPLPQDPARAEAPLLPLELEQRVLLCHEVLHGNETVNYPMALQKEAFEILRHGFDAGDLKPNTYIGFMAAVLLGEELLVRAGLPATSKSTKNVAVDLAIRCCDVGIARLLFDRGAVPTKRLQALLVEVVEAGHGGMVHLILSFRQFQLSMNQVPLFFVLPLLKAARSFNPLMLRKIANQAPAVAIEAALRQAQARHEDAVVYRLRDLSC